MENIEFILGQVESFLEQNDTEGLYLFLEDLNISEVKDLIDEVPEYGQKFIELMSINRAVHTFRILDFPVQQRIFKKLSVQRIKDLINELPPDDRTSFLSELSGDVVKKLIILLPPEERKEAMGLLGYEEDSIGRLMTPDYVAVKPDWDVATVLDHIRKFGKESETIDVIYVIDDDGLLIDDLQIRKILTAPPNALVKDLVDGRLISLHAIDHQEEAIETFRLNNRVALPVTNNANVLLGIVTVDDILWIQKEEYTEDMQKIGGTEALDEPYLDTPIMGLFRRRVGWLSILMVGGFFTTYAMDIFQTDIDKLVFLSIFVPLVISCGGNSGSQASTLIIQAMALGEVTIKDWWQVMRREIVSGALLGATLGVIGFLRILIEHYVYPDKYGDMWFALSGTISFSLFFIVLWGSLSGSMLPIILKKLGVDPATSSNPFVATLVDVTGVIIYFGTATYFLGKFML